MNGVYSCPDCKALEAELEQTRLELAAKCAENEKLRALLRGEKTLNICAPQRLMKAEDQKSWINPPLKSPNT